jgi:hypothetical protein
VEQDCARKKLTVLIAFGQQHCEKPVADVNAIVTPLLRATRQLLKFEIGGELPDIRRHEYSPQTGSCICRAQSEPTADSYDHQEQCDNNGEMPTFERTVEQVHREIPCSDEQTSVHKSTAKYLPYSLRNTFI